MSRAMRRAGARYHRTMTHHRYPSIALLADYARAALGLVLVGIPLAATRTSPAVSAFLATLALVFAAFAASTLLRQARSVILDETGIAIEGLLPRKLAWRDLDSVRLRYFMLKRDRPGWMQLLVKAGGRRLALDSRIEGFHDIAASVAAAAEARHLALDAATRANFAALGLGIGEATPNYGTSR